MPEDKELIRRALLGDKQAQEKCTAQGIVLPCPCCCASVDIVCVPAHEHKILDLPAYQGGCFIECTGCTYAISGENKKEVLKAHNTRPAPPVGRCGECKNWNGGDCYRQELTKSDDFCSYFGPRED
mgnify:CR=1 FL=1